MKIERKILIAFILNLAFSIFEFIGGAITASVAIMSDAVHDLGDATSIGISYFLERKSKKQPDNTYTYGYARFSVMGSVITTFILLVGSVAVIYNAVLRIFNPVEINYNGMIIFALIGAVVNFLAAYFTSGGDSLNQRAVNLHMLEDVLGWVVILIGAVLMKFTDISVIDPLMSIGVAIFILVGSLKNLREVLDLFLAKIPHGIEIGEIEEHICAIDGVKGVHHVHVWSMDGQSNYATMHVVADGDCRELKQKIREELREHGIGHATLEFESEGEECLEEHCHVEFNEDGDSHGHSHGHHHHHH
ncbi:MAG: cation diffusion facilitator family transporter [Eubacteriales bacterium]